MTDKVVRVPTRPKANITEALTALRVGETIKFPIGTNYGSIRTLATVNGIKVRLRALDTGEIEVTRREDKPKAAAPEGTQDKLYDL